MSFHLFADTPACPFCSEYCNCYLCAPKRGEKYFQERNGGWRSWIAQHQGGLLLPCYCSCSSTCPSSDQDEEQQEQAPVKATPAPVKKRAPKTTPTAPAANVQVFDSSWSATAVFTVSGEPLVNAFLHGNTAHVVPVQQQLTLPLPPPALPPATGLTPELSQELQKRPYMFIRKLRKAWERLVSLPDPE